MSALLIDDNNSEDNWDQVLVLWDRIANWTHYKPSDHVFKIEIKQFLVALWNEKDWLKFQYPNREDEIEEFINHSKYLSIVADLANTAKHRRLTKSKRSHAAQTNYFGRVALKSGARRQLYYIDIGNGTHIEIMVLLRNALDELEAYRFELRAEAKQNSL